MSEQDTREAIRERFQAYIREAEEAARAYVHETAPRTDDYLARYGAELRRANELRGLHARLDFELFEQSQPAPSSGEAERLATQLEWDADTLKEMREVKVALTDNHERRVCQDMREAAALLRQQAKDLAQQERDFNEYLKHAEAELSRLQTVINKWHARADHGFDPEEDPETTAYWNGVKAVTREAKP